MAKSPYSRKEWHRKHSTSKEMRWLNKGMDAALKGVNSGRKSVQSPGSTQEDWNRAALSKGQMRAAIVVGAILPLLSIAGLEGRDASGLFLLVEFFLFIIPFLLAVLVFMIFNTATRRGKKSKPVQKPEAEAAEPPKLSQVSNPTNDPYLERWNNRKPPEIINLEMPELTFQSRYDFSKVRGFDFGMEDNPISIFIDGKNQLIAKEDILSLNTFLSQGYMEETEIPLFEICEKDVRFEPSSLGMDDYTRLLILPLTPTGKKPKYPLKMKFCLLSQDEHLKISRSTGKEMFGEIWYLDGGQIGKARIVCWKYAGKNNQCYIFQIRRGKDGLFLQKIEKPAQPL